MSQGVPYDVGYGEWDRETTWSRDSHNPGRRSEDGRTGDESWLWSNGGLGCNPEGLRVVKCDLWATQDGSSRS